MPIVNQISTIVQDSVNDALGGATPFASPSTTSDFVKMGEALDTNNLYDAWFRSLVNRIVKTIFAVRRYEPQSRGILRDEDEFGAFKQKVHYHLANAVDNPAFKIPQEDADTHVLTYEQSSPYDVSTTLEVTALIFGGQGTWSIEIVRPSEQIKTAFLNAAEMASFIDGIYVYIENSLSLEIERVEAMADNTGIAYTWQRGKSRNLLTEYNATLAAGATPLTVSGALSSPAFLRFAGLQIRNTLKFMRRMTTLFNAGGLPKFTPDDRVVVEMLTDFVSATATNMESDTYHRELVELPGYREIEFWQSPGANFDFADTSKISIANDAMILDPEDTEDVGEVTQGGIIAFIKDIDAVAANFGYQRAWEHYNERDDVYVHGEQARKGYAVDPNENMVVFYIADPASVTLTLSHAASSNTATSTEKGRAYSTTVTAAEGYTISSVAVTMGGTDITATAYTAATGKIDIPNVTGDLVITVSTASGNAKAAKK